MAITNGPAAHAPFGAITIYRIITVVWNAAETVLAWNERRRMINVSQSLSSDQNDDIGLTTSDIDNFARKGF